MDFLAFFSTSPLAALPSLPRLMAGFLASRCSLSFVTTAYVMRGAKQINKQNKKSCKARLWRQGDRRNRCEKVEKQFVVSLYLDVPSKGRCASTCCSNIGQRLVIERHYKSGFYWCQCANARRWRTNSAEGNHGSDTAVRREGGYECLHSHTYDTTSTDTRIHTTRESFVIDIILPRYVDRRWRNV